MAELAGSVLVLTDLFELGVRFLLDGNVSHRVCPHLKAAGHDAEHVAEIGLTSAGGQAVLGRARDQDRTSVSCDHDFVQLLFAAA